MPTKILPLVTAHDLERRHIKAIHQIESEVVYQLLMRYRDARYPNDFFVNFDAMRADLCYEFGCKPY